MDNRGLAGKYEIKSLIARGGMSEIYLAEAVGTNNYYVIKKMRIDNRLDDVIIHQSLIAEKDILKDLRHPELVRIEDAFLYNGEIILVMEYVEGITLEQYLRHNRRAQVKEAIRWMKQLADVLGYLHSRDPVITYQDLKPSNIMLRPCGDITLIDFGTARKITERQENDSIVINNIGNNNNIINNVRNDREGLTEKIKTVKMGTKGFCAPELFEMNGGKETELTIENDIFSFGMTFYSLLTGLDPAHPLFRFDDKALFKLMEEGDREEKRCIKTANNIIKTCTQQNPLKRYHSCADLYQRLEYAEKRNSFGNTDPGRQYEISKLKKEMRLSGSFSGIRKSGIVLYDNWEKIALPQTDDGAEIVIDLNDTSVRKISRTELKVFMDIVIVSSDDK